MFLSAAAHPFSVLVFWTLSGCDGYDGPGFCRTPQKSPDWRRLWRLTPEIQKLENSQLAPCTCSSCQVQPDAQFPSSPLWVSGVISAAFRSIGLLDGAGYWVIPGRAGSLQAVSRCRRKALGWGAVSAKLRCTTELSETMTAQRIEWAVVRCVLSFFQHFSDEPRLWGKAR